MLGILVIHQAEASESTWIAALRHEVNCSNPCETIILNGPIRIGTAEEFMSKLVTSGTVVELSSDGGVLRDALMIADRIIATGAMTRVAENSDCLSACALIWLAGKQRFVGKGARLGFHGVYEVDGVPITSIAGNIQVGIFLSRLSLNFAAIDFATRAAPHEFRWLSQDHAVLLGIKSSWD